MDDGLRGHQATETSRSPPHATIGSSSCNRRICTMLLVHHNGFVQEGLPKNDTLALVFHFVPHHSPHSRGGHYQCCTGICPAHGSVKGYVHWFVIPAWTSCSYANTTSIPGHWMCLPTLNLVINPYLAQRWAWKPLNIYVFVHYACFRRCTGLLCAQRTTGSGSY
jgi:hypothetical protein